jgi:hypothetical protein
MHSILRTFLQTPVSGEEKRGAYRSEFPVCVFGYLLSLTFAYSAAQQEAADYLLTTEKMAKNDHPSYLVNMLHKLEGWIESSCGKCWGFSPGL